MGNDTQGQNDPYGLSKSKLVPYMISCEKAALICCKAQYKDATVWEKMKLTWHRIFCSTCGLFIKKNSQLTSLCEKAKLQGLTQKDKLEMKEELQKKN